MTGRAVPEWVSNDANAAIPARVKARVFERDGGRCQYCTRKLGPGFSKFAFDHVIALANGGTHSEANIQLLCTECHAGKTARDVAEKSKVAKVRAKHLGITRPKHTWGKRPMNPPYVSNTKYVNEEE